MNWVSIILVVVFGGIILGAFGMIVTGIVRIWISAFRNSIIWGLGCLFIPFCTWIYLIVHWQDAKSGFFLYLKGIGALIVGGMLAAVVVPNFEGARAVQLAHAKEQMAANQSAKDEPATTSTNKDRSIASVFQKNRPAASPSRQPCGSRVFLIIPPGPRPSSMETRYSSVKKSPIGP